MINSIFPIRDRVYFLKKGRIYQEYRYTERGNSFSGIFTKKTVNIKTNNKIVHPMTLPYEQETWDNAPKNIRQALSFSFFYHKHHKKVANVETINWLAIPYYSALYEEGKKKHSLFIVHGNHKKNLRIGHIHLTYDMLGKKEVFCVHWDIGASRLSPSIFIHWLLDDMSS